MVILSLDDGWYSLENSPDGPFFWSADEFSIYIESPVSELELYLNCNKTKTPYKIKYTTDGWVTESTVELNGGTNSLNLVIDGKKRIDFKCDYFIPSQIGSSSDTRKLGVQLFRALCKTIDDKCYELSLNDVKTKCDFEFENHTGEINLESFKITLGSGWHDLEEEKFRWSTGQGILYIKDSLVKTLKLNFSSPINQKITVKTDLNKTLEFDVKEGNQSLYLNDLFNVTSIEIVSKQFTPSVIENVSSDKRQLGIQLFSVDISTENFEIKSFFARNMFFEKDFAKLTNFLHNYDYGNKLFNFNSDGHVRIMSFKNNDGGKFDLNDQTVFYTHRSGWAFAINSIRTLHTDGGVKFEGFLERTFSWEKYKNIRNNVIPLKAPWVGVIHNPMLSENCKSDLFSTSKLFNSIVFQKSLEMCKGLYVLSNDLKEKIKNKIGNIPLEFCYFPTETPKNVFTIEKFHENNSKKLINVGSWARKFLTIFLVNPPSDLKKVMIEPSGLTPEKFKHFLEIEKSEVNCSSDLDNLIEMLGYLDSETYDDLMSKNIMFMDFLDISASNLIIECIVRNTPILVKKHPAVIDYLGNEYPFYFESVQEATEKINNRSLIEKTYEYLTTLKTKRFLTGDHFFNSIKNGKIYNSL